MKNCIYCKKEFKPRNYRQACCSPFCSMEIKKIKQKDEHKTKNYAEIECVVCKNLFKPKYIHHKFCSEACVKQLRKTLEIQKPITREYFLERANFQCEECFKANNSNLELHHKVPLYKGGADTHTNIVVLCTACHLLKHNIL